MISICTNTILFRQFRDNLIIFFMDNSKNECSICYETIENCDLQLLDCLHKFHYDCIVSEFKFQLNNYNNSRKLECPYCRYKSGLLPLRNNRIPIKNINENYNLFLDSIENKDYDKIKVYFAEPQCHAILKTGINKGAQCKRKKKVGLFCTAHLK